jgi:hypothetical protein
MPRAAFEDNQIFDWGSLEIMSIDKSPQCTHTIEACRKTDEVM